MGLLLGIIVAIVAVVFGGVTGPAPVAAQEVQAAASQGQVGADVQKLGDQLKARLYATRDDEKAYIDAVVKLVDQGKLPRSLVQSTFQWARFKKPRPIIYFFKALEIRAEKMGLKTPEFEITTAGLVPQIR